ncbi:MAG TPA: hypothetical protein VE035_08630, partial [Puia sp.]|nr:hypothetical protein [Puia sp.]
RIFFRLLLDQQGELDILSNRPDYEVLREKNIHSLIGFSDGIGAQTEETLKEDYSGDPDAVRRRIASEIQGTEDDKSICFIKIIRS